MLLQITIGPALSKRITATSDNLGMTKREFMTRLIEAALPEWEKSAKPGPAAPTAAKNR